MLVRILLVSVLAVCIPAAAYPCGNATYLRGDEAVAQVARADTLLSRGKHREALRLVDRGRFQFENDGLRDRAELIETVARLRAYPRSAERAAALFEHRLKQDAEQPYIAARLAEAYALVPEKAARARELVEDLAARDLMPDAEGFATLALLRARAGDAAGRDEAVSRCRKMTKRRAVCRVPASELRKAEPSAAPEA